RPARRLTRRSRPAASPSLTSNRRSSARQWRTEERRLVAGRAQTFRRPRPWLGRGPGTPVGAGRSGVATGVRLPCQGGKGTPVGAGAARGCNWRSFTVSGRKRNASWGGAGRRAKGGRRGRGSGHDLAVAQDGTEDGGAQLLELLLGPGDGLPAAAAGV